MHKSNRAWKQARLGLSAVAIAAGGCAQPLHNGGPMKPLLAPPPAPVGSANAEFWRAQERNAEASDFVIHEHEFVMGGVRMNYAGEDHVKQIAARLLAGSEFPVLVERSRHSVDPNSTYRYPVHLNPQLDMARREVVVAALLAMGVADAEQRVVVSPALATPYTGNEAQAAYLQGLRAGYGGAGGRGGGFGGGGFGGGGFGGGGFF